jgi:hypothetical protein
VETILGSLAFACLIAAQFLAVVAVNNAEWDVSTKATYGRRPLIHGHDAS